MAQLARVQWEEGIVVMWDNPITQHHAVQVSQPIVQPLNGYVGATVAGLRLNDQHGVEVSELLNRALHEHGVLFVRTSADVDDEAQICLASVFGEPQRYAFSAGSPDGRVVTVLDSEGHGSCLLYTSDAADE